jgi:hypothetical protein
MYGLDALFAEPGGEPLKYFLAVVRTNKKIKTNSSLRLAQPLA